MTTLKDYAYDLVCEVIGKATIALVTKKELSQDEVNDLIDEFIEKIKSRLIGE